MSYSSSSQPLIVRSVSVYLPRPLQPMPLCPVYRFPTRLFSWSVLRCFLSSHLWIVRVWHVKVIAVATAIAVRQHEGQVRAQGLCHRGALPGIVGKVGEEDARGVGRRGTAIKCIGRGRVGVGAWTEHGNTALAVVCRIQPRHAQAVLSRGILEVGDFVALLPPPRSGCRLPPRRLIRHASRIIKTRCT